MNKIIGIAWLSSARVVKCLVNKERSLIISRLFSIYIRNLIKIYNYSMEGGMTSGLYDPNHMDEKRATIHFQPNKQSIAARRAQ